MTLDGYIQYQQNQLMTASPAKLLIAAYDGAIRFCRVALEKMREGRFDEQSLNINKALAIICELLSTLREDVEPTLVGRLKMLYTYVIERLAYANLNQDGPALEEAIRILGQLRETWSEADQIIQRENQREEAA
ncbi:MAG: flagellar export chaperone FliS [Armatimonadetes bacterium]|nr:flagellar export chaperone FliS [Armatimonadota bacterium]